MSSFVSSWAIELDWEWKRNATNKRNRADFFVSPSRLRIKTGTLELWMETVESGEVKEPLLPTLLVLEVLVRRREDQG